MLDLKRRGVALALKVVLVVAGAQASQDPYLATFRRKKEDREQVLARVEPDGRS
jgi:hypothetical protein